MSVNYTAINNKNDNKNKLNYFNKEIAMMKNLSILVVVIFISLFFFSCSGSQEAVSYSYEKLDQKRQDAYTEVWTYRYSVAEEPWEEVKIYVKNEKLTYIINVGTYFGHQEKSMFIIR